MHAGGYFRIGNDNTQTIGASLRYFTMGKLTTWDASGRSLGVSHPNEFAIDASYARKLSPNFSLAVALRYIHSDQGSREQGDRPGSAFAADIAGYHQKYITIGGAECLWTKGFNIRNIGTKNLPLTEGRLPPSSPQISVWVRDSSTPSTRRT